MLGISGGGGGGSSYISDVLKDATLVGGQGILPGGTGTARIIPFNNDNRNGRKKFCGEGGKGGFELPEAGACGCVEIGLKQFLLPTKDSSLKILLD